MRSITDDAQLAAKLNAQYGYQWVAATLFIPTHFSRLVDHEPGTNRNRYARLTIIVPQYGWRRVALWLDSTVVMNTYNLATQTEEYLHYLVRLFQISDVELTALMSEKVDDPRMEEIL